MSRLSALQCYSYCNGLEPQLVIWDLCKWLVRYSVGMSFSVFVFNFVAALNSKCKIGFCCVAWIECPKLAILQWNVKAQRNTAAVIPSRWSLVLCRYADADAGHRTSLFRTLVNMTKHWPGPLLQNSLIQSVSGSWQQQKRMVIWRRSLPGATFLFLMANQWWL